MSEGQLRCCGSSLFLKKTYGVGYQLTLEKSNASEDGGKNDNLASHDETLERIVTGNVEGASLLTNVASEMSFQLPMGAASQFAPMFKGLDEEIDRGVVGSYGVSITTLDEVFLLVARGESHEKTEHLASSAQISSSVRITEDGDKSARSRMDLDNDVRFSTHLVALFRKRAANFRRDKKAWCCTVIMPSIFVMLGLFLFKFGPNGDSLGTVSLSLDAFNTNFGGTPKNPIIFNSAGVDYTCQPGSCALGYEDVNNPLTEENYFFCGEVARLEGRSCSISESNEVLGRLDDFQGASAVDTVASNVTEASSAIFESADVFQASMYGSVFFHHETSSSMDNGQSYGEAAVAQCLNVSSTANYIDSETDCEQYRGFGYGIHYNFTALHSAPLYQTLADLALVREALTTDSFVIETNISPLPLTDVEAEFGEAANGFSLFFLIVLSFVSVF